MDTNTNDNISENATEPQNSQEPQTNPDPQPMPQSSFEHQPHWLPPKPEKNRSKYIIPAALVIGCLPWAVLGCILLIAVFGFIAGSGDYPEDEKHIALIRVEGEIMTGESGGGIVSSGIAGSETIIRQLEQVKENPNAKGVVLRIDSPGGSPAASEEVYNEIMRIKKSGKFVYVSMGDMATSGGYYIAAAADKIYADSATLTGSIGVIWRSGDMSKLYKTIGYNPTVLKAGKYKDISSSSRPMTQEEMNLIQQLVNNTHMDFMLAVSKGRRIPLTEVRKLAQGMIYDGKQAKKMRLVDEIGGIEETKKAIAKKCGLGPDAVFVDYQEYSILEDVLSSSGIASEEFGATFARGAMKAIMKEKGELR